MPRSRDHLRTLDDDQMCVTLHKAMPAIDQALSQIQRDMARPAGDDGRREDLNSLFLAMSQIQNRLIEFSEKGRETCRQRLPPHPTKI